MQNNLKFNIIIATLPANWEPLLAEHDIYVADHVVEQVHTIFALLLKSKPRKKAFPG